MRDPYPQPNGHGGGGDTGVGRNGFITPNMSATLLSSFQLESTTRPPSLACSRKCPRSSPFRRERQLRRERQHVDLASTRPRARVEFGALTVGEPPVKRERTGLLAYGRVPGLGALRTGDKEMSMFEG